MGSMNILTRPSYRRSVKKLSASQIAAINVAIARLPEAFGHPHVHTGLSIRRLRPAIFEIRVGLQLRVLFAYESGDAVLILAGNHDEVRAWLKENI
jgi:hypothetical protein